MLHDHRHCLTREARVGEQHSTNTHAYTHTTTHTHTLMHRHIRGHTFSKAGMEQCFFYANKPNLKVK